MAVTKRLNLSWDDFHSTVSKSFSSMRDEDYLADVTLITDDNKQVSAHKLVMSASSAYFKSIFKINKNLPSLFLCLEKVNAKNLSHLLDYMYNGEVQIEEENLEEFLTVARRFKLEGLCEKVIEKANNGKEDKSLNEEVIEDEETKSQQEEDENESKLWKNIPLKQELIQSGMEIKELIETGNELKELIETGIENIKESKSYKNCSVIRKIVPNKITQGEKELNEVINQFIERHMDKGKYECKLCGKVAKIKTNLKNHIETHMEGLEFSCKMCERKFKTRIMLAVHVSKVHKSNKSK